MKKKEISKGDYWDNIFGLIIAQILSGIWLFLNFILFGVMFSVWLRTDTTLITLLMFTSGANVLMMTMGTFKIIKQYSNFCDTRTYKKKR